MIADKEITILELFSGIGGFSKGLTEAGYTFKKHYFSEIDKHAIANYKHNFSKGEYLGSVRDVYGSRIERPDIITFGSPCQDFSLAGKRLGMEGQRSVLLLEAIRIIRECRPSIFIWENVKGAFSSNDGADFWAIIAAFTNIGGYRLEWQLLNTSWFLPQNRERIYLIGHLAEAGGDFKGVFPITEVNFRSNETRPDGKTNTLNGVQKDNLIFLSEPTHKHGEERIYKGDAPTIQSRYGTGGDNIPYVNNIRRLTEIECERLQGFQDNWTEFGNYDGVVKRIPKTQRYKLLGNAVTVNVVKAIGERLKVNNQRNLIRV